MSLSASTARRVSEIVERAQSTGRAPSLVLGVVRDGELVHFAGAGETPSPDAQTQYRLGSITKTVTATLIFQLRDEGVLALDDPLDRHLPGTPVGGVTLRHLLAHVSGMQREPEGPWWERNAGGSVEQLLAGLSPEKLVGAPFRRYRYSNLAYGLLGAMLERLTGESWATLAGKGVLDPLGMKNTTYAPVEPFARGYVVDPLDGTLHEEPRLDAGAMAPAGQLWSTVTDMARWVAFLSGPTAAVLSRESVDEMCTPVVVTGESWTGGHGLGPEFYRSGERVYVGHGGSMPGYNSLLAVHRPTRTGVIVFANSYGLRGATIGAVGIDALNAVLDASPAVVEPWRPSAEATGPAAELCGRWWWMGREYEVRAEGADVVMAWVDGTRAAQRFALEGPDRWRGLSGQNEGEVLAVLRNQAGLVEKLDIATFVFGRSPEHLA